MSYVKDNEVRAVIMCRDPMLSRLLEIELMGCGIRMAESREGLLFLWDLDSVEFSLTALPDGARLICWSSAPRERFSDLSGLQDRVCFLHRPFSLEALEACILLFADIAHSVPLRASALSLPLREEPVPGGEENELHLTVTDVGIRFGEQNVFLTPREMALFRRLWEHRGQLVTKAALREVLEADESRGATANTLEVYIYHLRNKIEKPIGRRLIATERGKGYRLEI